MEDHVVTNKFTKIHRQPLEHISTYSYIQFRCETTSNIQAPKCVTTVSNLHACVSSFVIVTKLTCALVNRCEKKRPALDDVTHAVPKRRLTLPPP